MHAAEAVHESGLYFKQGVSRTSLGNTVIGGGGARRFVCVTDQGMFRASAAQP